MQYPNYRAVAAFSLATLMLGGCARFEARRGLDETAKLAEARGIAVPADAASDCREPASGLQTLLATPLDAERAVQVALTCNPGIAAEYARLGIARAEAFEAARLANPRIEMSALDSSAPGAAAQLGAGIAQSFTSLILRGPRTRLAEGEFLRAQQLLAGSILVLADDVQAAYYHAVGARQVRVLHETIAEAAEASAELVRRYRQAGNLSAREQAEAEAEAAEAQAALLDARSEEAERRGELGVLLGLPPATGWVLPDGLGLPVLHEDAADDLAALAMQSRLDLLAARQLVAMLTDQAVSARRHRLLGDAEVGLSYERDGDRTRLLGPTLGIELPLFNRGQGATARAAAWRDWSMAEQRRLDIEVRNAVATGVVRVAHARARVDELRERLLPRRAAVVDRMQEEVNFMLRGTFELLAARREQYRAFEAYLTALRDYWLARVALTRAVGARLPSEDCPADGNAAPQALLNPPGADAPGPTDMAHGHDHAQHAAIAGHGEHDQGEAGAVSTPDASVQQSATPTRHAIPPAARGGSRDASGGNGSARTAPRSGEAGRHRHDSGEHAKPADSSPPPADTHSDHHHVATDDAGHGEGGTP